MTWFWAWAVMLFLCVYRREFSLVVQMSIQLMLATWLTTNEGIQVYMFHVTGVLHQRRERAMVGLLAALG